MIYKRSNIVLIGMPGAGKSTVGVILAKMAAKDFVDTDLIVQSAHGRSLQDIVDHEGYLALRRMEEEVLLKLALENHVIATGGSAVYSQPAMANLRAGGVVVFLDVDIATLESRIHNFATRGVVRRPGQSLAELYSERLGLYESYADLRIACSHMTQEAVCARIMESLREQP